MTVRVGMMITGELVSHSLLNGNKGFQPLAFFLDDGTKTLVMPLQNGTQKDVELGPDFRRDDDEGLG
jgi:hypothetical protein